MAARTAYRNEYQKQYYYSMINGGTADTNAAPIICQIPSMLYYKAADEDEMTITSVITELAASRWGRSPPAVSNSRNGGRAPIYRRPSMKARSASACRMFSILHCIDKLGLLLLQDHGPMARGAIISNWSFIDKQPHFPGPRVHHLSRIK